MRFISIKEKHLPLILKWRTSDFVTKYMYTDIEYDMEQQKKWYQLIQADSASLYWLIEYKDQPIGLVSITDIHKRDQRAYWNFYIGEPAFSMLGGFIGPYLYNYAFGKFGFNKLMGEVMGENEGVRKFHLKHGAREVGILHDHVYKNEKYHDVYMYEMTKNMWAECGKKFAKYMPEVQ